MAKRIDSLDALRGYAIMTMILSATEAPKVLPRWMYHAQVPPPDHVFTPQVFGITWVDLIFPFFLFSMGAAIPLSFRGQIARGVSRGSLLLKSVVRGLKLAFFAVFCIHMFPFMMGYGAWWLNYAVPMLAFALMFVLFMRNPFGLGPRADRAVTALAYAVAIGWMLLQPYAGGRPFSLYDNDIIIMILANVALAGALVYLLTVDNRQLRLVSVLVVMALFLSASVPGSWQQWLYQATPAGWLYQFRYLEYLLIIIPGTLVGDVLADWADGNGDAGSVTPRPVAWAVMLLSLAVVVCNVVALYNRVMTLNMLLSVALLSALFLVLRGKVGHALLWRRLCVIGAWLLVIGLCIEAFEGGIRKDDVTMSYLFVTGGLAVFALVFFAVVCDFFGFKPLASPFVLTGRNPMVAYVCCQMVVIPVLALVQVYPLMACMDHSPWLGLLKGIILTALSLMLTAYTTRRKWFWKT